ncbi:MAG: leucyl aminopeptidase family protein, partial [Methylocystis sp.]
MGVDIGLEEGARDAIPIDFIDSEEWSAGVAGAPERARAFGRACGFEAKPGQSLLAPGADGGLERVLFGVEAKAARSRDPFLAGRLATLLPPGLYRFDRAPADPATAALAFLLSSYRFSRYLGPKNERARLCAPEGVDAARIARIVRAVAMGRGLVNTPANDMGPEALAGVALE